MLKKSKVKVLLGICGGIAAYKSAYLASLLVKKSYDVKTVMTKGAVKFIAPLTFEALTGNCVHTDLFEKVYDESHTSLSKWADIILIKNEYGIAPRFSISIPSFINLCNENISAVCFVLFIFLAEITIVLLRVLDVSPA